MADFKEENTRETQRSLRLIRSTTNLVNMVYTVEFPEEDISKKFKKLGGTPIFPFEAPPIEEIVIESQEEWPRVLMIEGPGLVPQRNMFQEGIFEEASADEENGHLVLGRGHLSWKKTLLLWPNLKDTGQVRGKKKFRIKWMRRIP